MEEENGLINNLQLQQFLTNLISETFLNDKLNIISQLLKNKFDGIQSGGKKWCYKLPITI